MGTRTQPRITPGTHPPAQPRHQKGQQRQQKGQRHSRAETQRRREKLSKRRSKGQSRFFAVLCASARVWPLLLLLLVSFDKRPRNEKTNDILAQRRREGLSKRRSKGQSRFFAVLCVSASQREYRLFFCCFCFFRQETKKRKDKRHSRAEPQSRRERLSKRRSKGQCGFFAVLCVSARVPPLLPPFLVRCNHSSNPFTARVMPSFMRACPKLSRYPSLRPVSRR